VRKETARVEASRVEASRVEASRVEASRVEASRVEASRVEARAADAARAVRAETPRAVAHLDVLYAATARAEFLIRAPPALYAYPPPVLAPMVPPRWLAHGGLGVAARRSSNVASGVGE